MLTMKYFEKFNKLAVLLCNFLKISPAKIPHPVFWLLLLISLCVNSYMAVSRLTVFRNVELISVIIMDQLPIVFAFATLVIFYLDRCYFRRNKIIESFALLNALHRRINNHFATKIKYSENMGTLWSSLLLFLSIISAFLLSFNFRFANNQIFIGTVVFSSNAVFLAVVTINIYLDIVKIYALLQEFNDAVSQETIRSPLWIVFSPNQYKYTEIKFYVKTYWDILKIIATFNDIYGLHILNILIEVILVNLNLFNIMMKYMFRRFTIHSVSMHILSSFTLAFMFVYMGTFIISVCDKLNREKSRINDILLGMLQFKIIRSNDDKGPEMRALILKAINAINVDNIEMTAAGLFPLNYRTLFIILRLIPAYFLIIPEDI